MASIAANLRAVLRVSPATAFVAFALCVSFAGRAAGQSEEVRWVIDAETSLAWFQIEPHYSHLWATTCLDEPSWQVGEGRTGGVGQYDYSTRPIIYGTEVLDKRIPMFPRGDVSPVCSQAIEGTITVGDTLRWTGLAGVITVLTDSLIMGLDMRDNFMRKKVFETNLYRDVTFTLDSLISVHPGDTLFATVLGTFELRGVRRPASAGVAAWHEAGATRVLAQWQFPAKDLIRVYGMSRWALGMGVVLGRWKWVHMGVDLMLKPAGSEGARGAGSGE